MKTLIICAADNKHHCPEQPQERSNSQEVHNKMPRVKEESNVRNPPTKILQRTQTGKQPTWRNTSSLSPNFDLLEFNTDDDELLEKFLAKNEELLEIDNNEENLSESTLVPIPEETPQNPAVLITAEQNQPTSAAPEGKNIHQNFASSRFHMSVIPKMYFPGSNVTINYNFGK